LPAGWIPQDSGIVSSASFKALLVFLLPHWCIKTLYDSLEISLNFAQANAFDDLGFLNLSVAP